MAEMEVKDSGGKKGPGVKKAKKATTRVDLTPMVDLGFLLITFFIFTTTMSQPTAMKLLLPKDTDKPEERNKAKESGTLTLLLGATDPVSQTQSVFYYEGILAIDGSNFISSTYKKIRDVIIDKKRRTPDKDFVVIIKPSNEATYKHLVDILDEMAINDCKRYAMVEIADVEAQLIKLSESGK